MVSMLRYPRIPWFPGGFHMVSIGFYDKWIGKQHSPTAAAATDGRMNGRTDGGTDGRTDGRTDGGTDGRTHVRPSGMTDGRTDGWTDGQTDGSFVFC